MGRAFPQFISSHLYRPPPGARQESVRPLLQVNREIVVPRLHRDRAVGRGVALILTGTVGCVPPPTARR